MKSHGNSSHIGAGLLLGFNPNIIYNNNPTSITIASVIGPQDTTKNQWLDMTYGIGAVEPQASYSSQTNRFFVKGSNDISFYTNHEPNDPTCNFDLFFTCLPGSTSAESNICSYAGSIITGYRIANPKNLIDIISKSVHDSLYFDMYDSEINYQVKKDIDVLIKNQTGTIPDTGTISIMNAMIQTTNIPQFNSVNKLSGENKIDSLELVEFKLKSRILDSLTLIKDSLIFVYDSDSTVINAINALQNDINTLASSLTNIHSNYISMKAASNESAKQVNTAITPVNLMEYLEKKINVYNHLYNRVSFVEFNESEKNIIDSIASVCPLLGGNAVFLARSIQFSYNDSIFYDDLLLCNQQGVYNRLANKDSIYELKEEHFVVYPNPSTGELNIYLSSGDIYSIQIFNLLGQLVFKESDLKLKTTVLIDKEKLANGTYILLLENKVTGKIERKKINFNH